MSSTATSTTTTTATTSSHGMNVVSEQILEFLITEMSLYAAKSCSSSLARNHNNSTATTSTGTAAPNTTSTPNNNNNSNNHNNTSSNNSTASTTDNQTFGGTTTSATTSTNGGASTGGGATTTTIDEEESYTLSAEMAAAKLERMGYAVGYRITERLAQNKTWNASSVTVAQNKGVGGGTGGTSTSTTSPTNTGTATNTTTTTTNTETQVAQATSAQQLEAVKFLCKEVWMEIFRKQIDKLQTNHRGVFVLKDLELKWLLRFPIGTENARVSAIRLLAFPCGIIRGALANIGIPAVVSCDFLADGQRMSACSFNIKVK